MKLLTSNEWHYRLLRTIIQGVIGVLIANADMIVSQLDFDAATKTMIVAFAMSVLSPIMAEIGRKGEEKAEVELANKTSEGDKFVQDHTGEAG